MTASGERAPVPYPEQGFGRSVRLLRLRRGWTQRQLAERAGITGPGVSRIEKGANGSNLVRPLALLAWPFLRLLRWLEDDGQGGARGAGKGRETPCRADAVAARRRRRRDAERARERRRSR